MLLNFPATSYRQVRRSTCTILSQKVLYHASQFGYNFPLVSPHQHIPDFDALGFNCCSEKLQHLQQCRTGNTLNNFVILFVLLVILPI